MQMRHEDGMTAGKTLWRRRGMAVTLALLGASLLSGCASSAVGVLNLLEPKGRITITRDLAYAPGPRHGLDVYMPRRPAPNAPVVVFLYGGGWDSGAKGMYTFVGAALASHGYVTIVPDYRLYPEVRYPDFLQDSALAVRWARDHAATYGGDPNRLFLVGHSAGAYNVAMLALDNRWLGAVGMSPADLKGVAGLAGPYDFLPLKSAELMQIFGPEDQRPDGQPINHVGPGAPPMFLAHDVGDSVVYIKNTQNLAAKLRAHGDEVETRYYDGLDHSRMVGAIATPLRFMAPVFRDLTDFIDRRAAAASVTVAKKVAA